ncbi:MAG: PKD domain-containing protein [Thermoanaerobaculia bacterium]
MRLSSSRGPLLALLVALASAAGAAPPSERPRGREECATSVDRSGDPGRLLEPALFDRLSSGGRRLARALNGLPGPARVEAAPPARHVGPLAAPEARRNVRVNDPSMDLYGHTNSESSVTATADTIVVGFNDAGEDLSGYAFSTDGGASFTHVRLPPPSDGYFYGDPVLATGPAGEVYYASLMSVAGNFLSTIGVSKSTDGGRTFAYPVDAVNLYTTSDEVMDKPWLAADTGASSKYRGNVYVTWTFFLSTGETFVAFARSTDGGLTFSAPGNLSPIDAVGVQGSAVAVGPAGEVYVAWLDEHVAPSGISLRKSTDGGASFGARVTVASLDELTMLTGGGGVRANSFPSLAVDGAGRVHVSWAALPASPAADRADVFYSRSTDGGATFSAARRLNDDATATTQAMPALAASPDGRVAVRWIDRRDDPANDALTGVSMAISADGGATFGRSFRVTDTTFAYGPVEPGNGRGYHGDYDGLAWRDGTFFVTWSDERGSDPDVYFARVPETLDPESPDLVVAASSPWASLRAGTSATFDLSTGATGAAAGPFSLSLTPPGPGLSFSFAPGSVPAGGSSRLTLAAAADVPGGDVQLTATAAGADLARATVIRATTYPASRPFETPVNATRTRGFTGGMARTDAAGRIHLLYEDDSDSAAGSEVYYRRSPAGDAVFTAPLRLSPAGGVGYDAVLATGPGDRVVAAWGGRASGDTNDRVWVARSTNGGETFSAAVAVSPTTQIGARPAVAVDGSGNVVVAWYDFAPSVALLYTARSTDGGATFGAAAAINDDAVGVVTRPGLAFDSRGAAYLVYTRQYTTTYGLATAARIAVARDGKTFAAPASLTDVNSVASFAPDVAVAPNDAVHVAYYVRLVTSVGTYNREVVAVRSTDGGAAFTAPVNLSRNNGQSWFPTLAVEPSGAVTVAWEDDTGRTTSDVLLVRSTDGGATFTDPVDVSADVGLSGSLANPLEEPGGSGRVAVSASAAGRLLVSWLDDSPANPDVFFVRLDPRALSNRAPTASIAAPAAGASFEAGAGVAFSGSGTDPDGDALSYSWSFGDGGRATGASPAPHPYARPGSYTAVLTVADPYGASSSATVAVTVTAPSTTGASLLVPVVLEADGVGGSRFTSELTLASRVAAPTEVLLSYTASLGEGSGFARLTLAPGEQRVVPGVVAWLRGQGLPIAADGGSQAGTLLVTFAGAPGGVFAGARTYTPDPAGTGGTYGVFSTAVPTTSGPVSVYGLQQNAAMRSNLAVVNGGNGPVTLRIALVGPAGEDLGLLPDQTLGPWGWAQLSQPLAGRATSGRAVVTRIAGASPFTAYGVLNDAVTSDGSWLPALLPDDGSGAGRLVPVVLDVEGVGARFRTELTFTNGTGAPLPLTLVYTAAPGFGSGSGSVPLTLAPFEQRIVPDAIAFLRQTLPIEADGRSVAGSLFVDAPGGLASTALAVGARTYVPMDPAGSFGLFYPGLTAAESASSEPVWVHALREDSSQRSNLALVNRGDAAGPIVLRVSYFGPLGAPLGTPVDVALAPGEWRQLGRPLVALGATAGFAKVERVSGTARFAAYGVLNDNVSSDGSYVPMTR